VIKLLAWLAGIGTFLGALVYMVVSLNRWEWNRALFFGLIVLIAEIALATGLVLRKLTRIDRAPSTQQATLAAIRGSRPEPPDRFAWLKETTRGTGVFITFVVAGGLIISVIGWLIDRIASTTSTALAEERLAGDLQSIAYPDGGIVVDDVTVLAQEVPGADDVQLRMLLRRAGRT
jgi:MFS family permease